MFSNDKNRPFGWCKVSLIRTKVWKVRTYGKLKEKANKKTVFYFSKIYEVV